jgi:hypothetical protein
MVFHKLIAFHLGGFKADGHRSPADCYGRATGSITDEHPNAGAMQAVMRSGDSLYNERYQAALRRMFAERGVDFYGDDMSDVLGKLIAEAEAGGMTFPELSAEAA